MTRSIRIVLAFTVATVAACGSGGKPEAPQAPAISEAAHKEASDLFSARCQACHGGRGLGDGPAAAALNPKPRNFGDREWQKKVGDDELRKAIVEGGPAVGRSPLMPPNPDLAAKPETVAALVGMVRGFGR